MERWVKQQEPHDWVHLPSGGCRDPKCPPQNVHCEGLEWQLHEGRNSCLLRILLYPLYLKTRFGTKKVLAVEWLDKW